MGSGTYLGSSAESMARGRKQTWEMLEPLFRLELRRSAFHFILLRKKWTGVKTDFEIRWKVHLQAARERFGASTVSQTLKNLDLQAIDF